MLSADCQEGNPLAHALVCTRKANQLQTAPLVMQTLGSLSEDEADEKELETIHAAGKGFVYTAGYEERADVYDPFAKLGRRLTAKEAMPLNHSKLPDAEAPKMTQKNGCLRQVTV